MKEATTTSKTLVEVTLTPEDAAALKTGELIVLVHCFDGNEPHNALVGTPTEIGDYMEARVDEIYEEDEGDEGPEAELDESDLPEDDLDEGELTEDDLEEEGYLEAGPAEVKLIEDVTFTGLVITLPFDQADAIANDDYVVMVGKPDDENEVKALFGHVEDFVADDEEEDTEDVLENEAVAA